MSQRIYILQSRVYADHDDNDLAVCHSASHDKAKLEAIAEEKSAEAERVKQAEKVIQDHMVEWSRAHPRPTSSDPARHHLDFKSWIGDYNTELRRFRAEIGYTPGSESSIKWQVLELPLI